MRSSSAKGGGGVQEEMEFAVTTSFYRLLGDVSTPISTNYPSLPVYSIATEYTCIVIQTHRQLMRAICCFCSWVVGYWSLRGVRERRPRFYLLLLHLQSNASLHILASLVLSRRASHRPLSLEMQRMHWGRSQLSTHIFTSPTCLYIKITERVVKFRYRN